MLRRAPFAHLRAFQRSASFVSIDGIIADPHRAAVSVFDTSVQRGNGAFEVVRVLPNGRLRAPELHLDRLERTAAALEFVLPPRAKLLSWLSSAAQAGAALDTASGGSGVGAVRLLATRGGQSLPVRGRGMVPVVAIPHVFIVFECLPEWPASVSLCPFVAPWHPAGPSGRPLDPHL